MKLLTDFAPDPERLAVLAQCIDHYGVGDPKAEWPNNLVSRRTVVYGSGRIARVGDVVRHAVDPDELASCRAMAHGIAASMKGVSVGMGSDASDDFRAFWIVANADEPPLARIDEAMIRRAFGSTLFPLLTISVEPLAERGAWWDAVCADGEGVDGYLDPWRKMIAWFYAQDALVDAAFVCIGDRRALWKVDSKKALLPPGTEMTGCVLPRLALGLTKKGSLVGLFGQTVQT